jgi:serine/threonine-protein phosphatase 6 regulatory ankyrin repeat subunit B
MSVTLERAIQENRAGAVSAILDDAAFDINAPCDPQRYDSVSPLMTALRAGNLRFVAAIAAHPRFDLARSLPDYERWSWARTASPELLRLYLAIPGADVNQRDGNGKTLLHEVVYDLTSDEKVRELLSRRGVEIDPKQFDDTTPLYRAGLAGNARAFRLLLERDADVNDRNNSNRWTILICAAAANGVEIAEPLLERRDLDVNAADDKGDTALHVASDRGHTRIVELLLARPDIQINLRNQLGWSPLTKASFGGHVDVVRRLLARSDAEVNTVDHDGQTPLFHAVSNEQLEVVRLLLADPRTVRTIANRRGHTALDQARVVGFTEIAELLR